MQISPSYFLESSRRDGDLEFFEVETFPVSFGTPDRLSHTTRFPADTGPLPARARETVRPVPHHGCDRRAAQEKSQWLPMTKHILDGLSYTGVRLVRLGFVLRQSASTLLGFSSAARCVPDGSAPVKEECLSKLILFGEDALKRALEEFIRHGRRAIHGISNCPYAPAFRFDTFCFGLNHSRSGSFRAACTI